MMGNNVFVFKIISFFVKIMTALICNVEKQSIQSFRGPKVSLIPAAWTHMYSEAALRDSHQFSKWSVKGDNFSPGWTRLSEIIPYLFHDKLEQINVVARLMESPCKLSFQYNLDIVTSSQLWARSHRYIWLQIIRKPIKPIHQVTKSMVANQHCWQAPSIPIGSKHSHSLQDQSPYINLILFFFG